MRNKKPSSLKIYIYVVGTMIILSLLMEYSRGTVSIIYRGIFHDYSAQTTGIIEVSEKYLNNTGRGKAANFRIEYGYSVDSKYYYSSYVGHIDSADRVVEMLSKYQLGNVIVYYDPSSPNMAILEKGGFSLFVYMFLFLIILSGFLVYAFILLEYI